MRTVGFLATGLALAFAVSFCGHIYGDLWAHMFGGDGRWDCGYFVGVVGTLTAQSLLRKWTRDTADAS